MGLKRISEQHVIATCVLCSTANSYALADLRAGQRMVIFPRCPACQKGTLQGHLSTGPITQVGRAGQMQSWIRALHQKLVAAGQLVDGVTLESIPSGMYDGAVTWPVGDEVVEAMTGSQALEGDE